LLQKADTYLNNDVAPGIGADLRKLNFIFKGDIEQFPNFLYDLVNSTLYNLIFFGFSDNLKKGNYSWIFFIYTLLKYVK
jgi:hypothetical protein